MTSPNSRARRYNEKTARRLTAAVELLPFVAICELARKLGGECEGLACSCEAVWTTEKLMRLLDAKQALNLVPELTSLSNLNLIDMLDNISFGRCDKAILCQASQSALRDWLKLTLLHVSFKSLVFAA